ncbi:SAM-dependent methyltransferase, partial [Streptacidiphilus jiangxiensis]
DRPRWARLQSRLLGGGDHLAPDRELADALAAVDAPARALARAGRTFVISRAAELARQGVGQFLVLGCGYPAPFLDAVHDVVLPHQPAAVVVYADADVSVMAHARALLTAPPPAVIRYLRLDLAAPAAIASALANLPVLDMDRPVALMLADGLQQLSDDQAHRTVALLHDLVSAGSTLTFSHPTLDSSDAHVGQELERAYGSAGIPFHPRTRAGLAALLGDWQLHGSGITELELLPPAHTGPATSSRYGVSARKSLYTAAESADGGPR